MSQDSLHRREEQPLLFEEESEETVQTNHDQVRPARLAPGNTGPINFTHIQGQRATNQVNIYSEPFDLVDNDQSMNNYLPEENENEDDEDEGQRVHDNNGDRAQLRFDWRDCDFGAVCRACGETHSCPGNRYPRSAPPRLGHDLSNITEYQNEDYDEANNNVATVAFSEQQGEGQFQAQLTSSSMHSLRHIDDPGLFEIGERGGEVRRNSVLH